MAVLDSINLKTNKFFENQPIKPKMRLSLQLTTISLYISQIVFSKLSKVFRKK